MARARNIKPSIMTNDELAALPALTRLLFIYLWMLADKSGRLEDKPKRIAAQALPYDGGADVDAMLCDLQRGGFIRRYVAAGTRCIAIVAFSKHQNPHVREAESDLPAEGIAEAQPRQCLGDDEALPNHEQARLIPDSGFLIPDPPIKALPAPVVVDNFERFWSEWPASQRKAAKAQCRDKWRTSGADAEPDRVIQSVRDHKASEAWQKDGGQFIPAPLVWLNQQRWTVEFPKAPAQKAADETQEYLRGMRDDLAASRPPQEALAALRALGGRMRVAG